MEMEALHDDMLMEVLCRALSSTTGELRAVCKRWRALLSSPAFAKLAASHYYADTSHAHRRRHAAAAAPEDDDDDDDADADDADADDGHGKDAKMWLLLYTQEAASSSSSPRDAQARTIMGGGGGHCSAPALAALQHGAFGYQPSCHLCIPVPLLLACGGHPHHHHPHHHRFYAWPIDAGSAAHPQIRHIIRDELLVSSHLGPLICRRIIHTAAAAEADPGIDDAGPGVIKELYFEGDPLQLRRKSFGTGTGSAAPDTRAVPPPPGLSAITRAGVAPGCRGAGFQILVMGVRETGITSSSGPGVGDSIDAPPLLYTSNWSPSPSGMCSGKWEVMPTPPARFAQPSSSSYPPWLNPRSRQSMFVWWRGSFCTLSGDALYMLEPGSRVWTRIGLPSQPRIWDARFLTIHVLLSSLSSSSSSPSNRREERLVVEGNFQEQGDFVRRYPLRIGLLELRPSAAVVDQGDCGRASFSHTWTHLGFMPDGLSRRLCSGQPQPAHSLYTCYSRPRSSAHLFFIPSVVFPLSRQQLVLRPQQHQVVAVVFDISSESWDSKPLPPAPSTHHVLSSPNFKGFTL